MKKYILAAILMVATIGTAFSQKVITKKVDVTGKKMEMKFDFADSIRIEAWSKNTVELEVSVNIDNNRFNDYYKLNENNFSGNIDWVEKIDFEAIKKIKGSGNNCNFDKMIRYKLKVPSNLEFSLKTIAGQIILEGSLGKMSVNSISGFIDYAVPASMKARINLSTVTGDVYSNLKFDNKPSKEMSWVGTKRDLTLNSGSLPIKLETVSGNIYLRKSKL
jgi:predicted membrane protein